MYNVMCPSSLMAFMCHATVQNTLDWTSSAFTVTHNSDRIFWLTHYNHSLDHVRVQAAQNLHHHKTTWYNFIFKYKNKNSFMTYLHCNECGGRRKGIMDSESFLIYWSSIARLCNAQCILGLNCSRMAVWVLAERDIVTGQKIKTHQISTDLCSSSLRANSLLGSRPWVAKPRKWSAKPRGSKYRESSYPLSASPFSALLLTFAAPLLMCENKKRDEITKREPACRLILLRCLVHGLEINTIC